MTEKQNVLHSSKILMKALRFRMISKAPAFLIIRCPLAMNGVLPIWDMFGVILPV